MTRTHRRLHLWMWLTLAPLSVLLLCAALITKKPAPIQQDLLAPENAR